MDPYHERGYLSPFSSPQTATFVDLSPSPQFSPNRRDFDDKYPEYWSAPPLTDKDDKSHVSLLPKRVSTLMVPALTNSKPLFRGFEPPNYRQIALFTLGCVFAYPAMHILTLVAKDTSLFTARILVALWSSTLGFSLGFMLASFAAKHLEAATWATVIHLSYEGSGMKLRDLANNAHNPANFFSAIKLLFARLTSLEADRRSRRSYDKRPWSLVLLFFVILMLVAAFLPFAFGRIMSIDTDARNQRVNYREVVIAGDLSPDDVTRASAQLGAFADFARTWTLSPYGTSAPITAHFTYQNETVYFAQANMSQFLPDGYGLGTFNTNGSTIINPRPSSLSTSEDQGVLTDPSGTILRFSQWGIRIHCQKLPEPQTYITPLSSQSFTYAYLRQDLLASLFGSFGLSLPQSLTVPDLTLLDANDTIPAEIDPDSLSYIIKWWNNGIAHSFHTKTVLDADPSNPGWTTVETVLIRLNTTYTPSGVFPVHSNSSTLDANGDETWIGYDVAVCVERYEPWIVETYNSSIGSPATLRLVDKGNALTIMPFEHMIGGFADSTRYLNSTNKTPAFYVAHDNSINQMVKDNGLDRFYVPSPTSVSFTDGAGPEGYIELSASRLATVRATVDAAYVLPYLVGTSPLIAHSFEDVTDAWVWYTPWQLATFLAVVLILGLIGALFVPALPLSVPRRGFGLYTWLTALQSKELRVEIANEVDKMMNLEEVEKKLGDKRVRFTV